MVPPVLVTRASLGSLLAGVAPMTRPSVWSLVRSFMLWMAMSIFPSKSSVSMSPVNAPFAPARPRLGFLGRDAVAERLYGDEFEASAIPEPLLEEVRDDGRLCLREPARAGPVSSR